MKGLSIILILYFLLPHHIHGQEQIHMLCSLEKKADAGDAEAAYKIAMIYDKGYMAEIKPDKDKMALYLKASASQGYAPAMSYLGYKYFIGEDFSKNPKEALRLFNLAAESGDTRAANNLGWLYLVGNEVDQSDSLAAYWLRKAAVNGLPSAMSSMASLYLTGQGVAKDTLTAFIWYDKALDAGFTDAQNELIDLEDWMIRNISSDSLITIARRHYKGQGSRLAVSILSRAELSEDADAIALLADAKSKGRGTAYDSMEATRLFELAAKKGNAGAQFILAEFLEIFPDALNDIEEDRSDFYITSDYWRNKAAEKGVTNAREAESYIFNHKTE